jgi:integrase
VRDDFDSSNVAPTTLVPDVAAYVDCISDTTPESGRPTSSKRSKPCKPAVSETGCMETINKQYKAKGFSKSTRKLLRASWRTGTQKDYSCKFRKFSSWCNSKQIDPFNASLTDCANFLSYLYDNGLKYKTISGYRSMMSAVLPTVEKFPIGKHPHVIRVLKGVFNSRPPEHRLIPEWDLPLVLQMLKQPPFEPMKLARLKYVTWKTVFLIAITTFKRCSDLQALRLGEGSVNIQKKGVTFVRHGLSKQDRQGHQSKTIFIPTFEDNKLLDPKRALFWYLKHTHSLRQETDENKLFLTTVKPYRPVSAQTISTWIVNTIKRAYKCKELAEPKIRGHSTRSIGPSWALFKGANIVDVMNSADWSRASTFIKFYLREVAVDFLKC